MATRSTEMATTTTTSAAASAAAAAAAAAAGASPAVDDGPTAAEVLSDHLSQAHTSLRELQDLVAVHVAAAAGAEGGASAGASGFLARVQTLVRSCGTPFAEAMSELPKVVHMAAEHRRMVLTVGTVAAEREELVQRMHCIQQMMVDEVARENEMHSLAMERERTVEQLRNELDMAQKEIAALKRKVEQAPPAKKRKKQQTLEQIPLGSTMEKFFQGHGLYRGMIVEYAKPYYKVVYEDGDCEEIDEKQIRSLITQNVTDFEPPANVGDEKPTEGITRVFHKYCRDHGRTYPPCGAATDDATSSSVSGSSSSNFSSGSGSGAVAHATGGGQGMPGPAARSARPPALRCAIPTSRKPQMRAPAQSTPSKPGGHPVPVGLASAPRVASGVGRSVPGSRAPVPVQTHGRLHVLQTLQARQTQGQSGQAQPRGALPAPAVPAQAVPAPAVPAPAVSLASQAQVPVMPPVPTVASAAAPAPVPVPGTLTAPPAQGNGTL